MSSLIKASNLKFRNFQYVMAVAQTRSFTRAAEQCHVTQSTLSSGIKDLEDALGRSLFDRSSRNIALSAFGETVLPDIRDVLQKADTILTKALSIDGKYSGPVRFGIIPTIAPYMLPHLLPHLSDHFPGISLNLYENMTQILLDKLRNGELDMAVIAFPYETGDLEHSVIYEEGFYLLRPASNNPVSVIQSDEIETDQLLLLEDGHCLRDHALSVCAAFDADIQKRFKATSLTTLVQMVRHGYGATLLPEMAAKNLDLPADLEIIPVIGDSAKRGIGLVWRKNAPLYSLARDIAGEIKNLEMTG